MTDRRLTESELDVNYLAFIREALDCAVVLVEYEATLGGSNRSPSRRALEHRDLLHQAQAIDSTVAGFGDDSRLPARRRAARLSLIFDHGEGVR